MEILSLSPEQFKSFVLILIRISIVLFVFPIFGSGMWPNLVKAGLALIMSIILLPVVQPDPTLFPETVLGGVYLILSELIFGLIIALTVRLLFTTVQLAGQLVGFQMGFAIANVLDPESGGQGPILAQIGYWVAVLIFLLLNGHHVVLNTLVESFAVVEVGSLGLSDGLFHKMLELSGDMFTMAVKIGAPAIAALLMTSAAFGIVAKVVPQMNVLIAAFPVKIVIGLFFFGFCLEALLYFMRHYVAEFEGMLRTIMNLML
ncbi:MAG: flagellar biosynthetic protein FliR [Deltaproteobacteria bacterium]|nr:flagellar biosynthetic protein FliR [Deltaproteobacteria bacterium]MBW2019118.1 flagellar biosynthetic protein FliR [Deltaproteobacteria bacterium]MBW2073185.1 flagellar biosynthetic protein FliR [Deltaproteobacteria bacterium]